ncbi:MAG: hypothetical protein M1829_002186 [Trizodia sp. TS-e1964]|nr:MAG: hypothetical protein M1829_002186 [Trizodia sp. TS-e1964]
MWLELRTIFNCLSQDSAVRAILFSGAGPKAFSTGLDVQAAGNVGPLAPQQASNASHVKPPDDPARRATLLRRHIVEFQDCVSAIELCEKAVISVLHGYTFGLGIDLACCADIRICSTPSYFSVKEVDIGLAADVGTLSRLPKIVGSASWVKDVCLTARVFEAPEALSVGFVSAVYESKEAALEKGLQLAIAIAAKSPVATAGTKELLNYSRDHSVADGLRYTGVWNSAMLQTNDVPLAMKSGLRNGVSPRFEKL